MRPEFEAKNPYFFSSFRGWKWIFGSWPKKSGLVSGSGQPCRKGYRVLIIPVVMVYWPQGVWLRNHSLINCNLWNGFLRILISPDKLLFWNCFLGKHYEDYPSTKIHGRIVYNWGGKRLWGWAEKHDKLQYPIMGTASGHGLGWRQGAVFYLT